MRGWDSVRRGEEKYIFPFQEQADVMFNTSLVYELPVMKKYVYPVLRAVTPDSPCYTRARRLVKFLNYFHTGDVEAEIPVNSILGNSSAAAVSINKNSAGFSWIDCLRLRTIKAQGGMRFMFVRKFATLLLALSLTLSLAGCMNAGDQAETTRRSRPPSPP